VKRSKQRKRHVQVLMILCICLLFSALGCRPGNPDDDKTTITRLLMDTRVDLTLYGIDKKTSERIAGEVFAEMERLESILSRTVAASDLDRVNRAAGEEWVDVSPELFFVLSKALEFAELSGGAFDPTVAPLLELWGFGTAHPRVPSGEELQKVLPLIDYRLVELDEDRSAVFLPLKGMKLDLGGIAKGFIIDRGIEVVRKFDVQASFLNAGGDIRIYGEKPSGERWTVGIQDPNVNGKGSDRTYIAALRLEGEGSVVTSGDYQRFFEENGKKYHHILNPADGKPARQLTSVTIVAGDALTADALSTAVFVLGREKGLSLLKHFPGVDGVIVDQEGKVHYSPGLEDKIQLNAQQTGR